MEAVIHDIYFNKHRLFAAHYRALAGDFRSITAASNAAYLKNERENGSNNNAATNGYKPVS